MQLATVTRLPRRPRLLLSFILLFPLALFLLAGLRAVQLAREGEVPDALRDLDCDGKVSLKSGQVLVVRCSAEPRCRRAGDLQRSR